MDLSPPPVRPRGESIVPMINVVFLLLIFFLMTSQIAPPEPFEVAPPMATTHQETDTEVTLYIGKTGEIAYQDHRGEDAVKQAVQAAAEAKVFRIRADADLEASTLASLLKSLSAYPLRAVELVVTPQ